METIQVRGSSQVQDKENMTGGDEAAEMRKDKNSRVERREHLFFFPSSWSLGIMFASLTLTELKGALDGEERREETEGKLKGESI